MIRDESHTQPAARRGLTQPIYLVEERKMDGLHIHIPENLLFSKDKCCYQTTYDTLPQVTIWVRPFSRPKICSSRELSSSAADRRLDDGIKFSISCIVRITVLCVFNNGATFISNSSTAKVELR